MLFPLWVGDEGQQLPTGESLSIQQVFHLLLTAYLSMACDSLKTLSHARPHGNLAPFL